MKKLFTMFAITAMMFAAGCQEYDDTPLKNRVTNLEELCNQMNTNIASLQTIVNALQNNDYITGVYPITKDGKTIGYTISFEKAQSITIYNGNDGASGTSGDLIFKSVTQDDDNVYFTLTDESVIVVSKAKQSSGADVIKFVDSTVKLICILNWDTDKDGELSYEEAKAVKTIGCKFNNGIISFEEFQYFTGVTSLQYEAFYHCYSLEKIILPNGLKTIGDQAFSSCNNLVEISLPEGLTTIGWDAFNGCCTLTSVTIPEAVTTIEDYAFEGCSSLTSVYCKSVTPPTLGREVFCCYNYDDYISPDLKIYVPRASVEAYKSATSWSEYASNIVGYDF